MKNLQIGIDQISDIGNDVTINPKNLICSICYCLNINPMECMNKKCSKLFCEKCVEINTGSKFENKNKKKTTCPYCRVLVDFTKAGDKLNDIIKNLKFFCQDLDCVDKYTLDEFILHLKEKMNTSSVAFEKIRKSEEIYVSPRKNNINFNNKCYSCKFIFTKAPLIKCSFCFNFGCTESASINNNYLTNKCNFIQKCFNCKTSMCKGCNTGIKLSRTDFLCGLCTINCSNCNTEESTIICELCKCYLCNKCSKKCDNCNMKICVNPFNCYKSKIDNCEVCKNKDVLEPGSSCIHLNYIICDRCYPKCSCNIKEDLNKQIFGIISNLNCNICEKKICTKFCSNKCKNCKSLVCGKCIKFCSICKNYNCMNCLKKCDECYSNIYSCNNCDIDTLRKCNYQDCDVKICLSCWNVCNTCEIIFCKKHSLNCINCEEQTCYEHIHSCKICNKFEDDKNFIKLCLKKCTLKCSFCENICNSFCDKNKHQNDIVKNLNCGHNVCKSCLKGCAKCGNVVVSCTKCIVNYFFNKCKTCNEYLCTSCSNFCNNCEDVYCSFAHKCLNCNKSEVGCLNCITNSRSRCKFCNKNFQICSECRSLYICSENCFIEFSNKSSINLGINDLNITKHLCRMFFCSPECGVKLNLKEEENLIEKKIDLENLRINFTESKNINNELKSEMKGMKNFKNNKVNCCCCCQIY